MALRPKIVAVGYYHHGTGLSRVMDVLIRGLGLNYEIHLLAIGYVGPRYERHGALVYPTNPNGGDVFAAFQAKEFIEELKPQIVFILHDIWMFQNYQQILAPVRSLSKFVAYTPLDGNIADDKVCAGLDGFDVVGVYTDWAKTQLENATKRLRNSSATTAGFPHLEVIGHGIDLDEFYPFPELEKNEFHRSGREYAKRRVFPHIENPESSFIVLNASCPSVRKSIPTTIEGFALFAEGKPDNVRLCLHQAITEEETQELVELAQERLGDRLLYNPLSPADGSPLSGADLNLLYNACDVGINTSSGEGWGLVSFEHAAAGAAQLIPRHSACQSLWQDDCCLFLNPHRSAVPFFSPLEMSFITAEEVAQALEKLYCDEALQSRLSKLGHLHSTQESLQWDHVVDQWSNALNSLIA